METKAPWSPASAEVAEIIAHAASAVYGLSLVGSGQGWSMAMHRRISAPEPDDVVCEISAVLTPTTQRVGRLLRIAMEPIDFGEAADPWNEDEEGRPHPVEKVFYIADLEGTERRWVNAKFVALPAAWGSMFGPDRLDAITGKGG